VGATPFRLIVYNRWIRGDYPVGKKEQDLLPGTQPKELISIRVTSFAREKAVLFRRVMLFLAGPSPWQERLRVFLADLQHECEDVYLFGGAVRDWMIFGSRFVPRDLDVVVSGGDMTRLRDRFQSLIRRQNRFGGLRLSVAGFPIDLWELSDTWAIREGFVQDFSVQGLVRTAFLNLDAVAFRYGREASPHAIEQAGFFDAVSQRLLELNLEAAPSPAHCIVHALALAEKTGYDIGPKLLAYIVRHAECVVNELETIQQQRFGFIRYDQEHFLAWLERAQNPHLASIPFNLQRSTQMDLCDRLENQVF